MTNDRIHLWKGLAITGGLLGPLLFMVSRDETATLARGSPNPTIIRYDDLVTRGPGSNIHVTVTQFRLAPGYVVKQEDTSWRGVWIPMRSANADRADDPQRIGVVVRSFRIRSQWDLDAFYRRKQVTGLVSASPLGEEAIALLRARNPGFDPRGVTVFADTDFPSPGWVRVRLLLSALLLLGGVFSAWRYWTGAREQGGVWGALTGDLPEEPQSAGDALLPEGYRHNETLIVIGGVGAIGSVAWGLATWNSIGQLERDEIQSLSMWLPLEFLYETGGRALVMVAFVVAFLLSCALLAAAGRGLQRVQAEAGGEAALRQALVEKDRLRSPFFRNFDEKGRLYTRRARILGAILVVLLIVVAVGIFLDLDAPRLGP